MLHFAHFEKRAERIGEKHYLVHIRYDKDDETEMVIRVLGFGPLIEVTEPNRFRNLIIERLAKAKKAADFLKLAAFFPCLMGNLLVKSTRKEASSVCLN